VNRDKHTNSKSFRIDWYYKDALIDLSLLKAEEIGVLVQIINFIYYKEGPIEFNSKHIGKMCNTQSAKCERIIHGLIQKDHIFINDDGFLFQKRCEFELDELNKRRKKSSENGKKGSDARWKNELNQDTNNSAAINEEIASTNLNIKTNNKTNNKTIGRVGLLSDEVQGPEIEHINAYTTGRRKYDVDHHLSDNDRANAKVCSPGWDQYALMETYNNWINKNGKNIPRDHGIAYVAWCKKYTKCKPPQ
jgi:uncharacterized protein YdaU (DUF1376 family)